MSVAAAVTAIVLLVIFLIGIGVGIIVVFAMSARRADKAERRDLPPETPRTGWPYRGEPGPDDDEPGPPPLWPERGDR